MARKMKDGKFGEEGKALNIGAGSYSNTRPCVNCKKILTIHKSKAIHTFSSKSFDGNQFYEFKQFCSWKCAEEYHG